MRVSQNQGYLFGSPYKKVYEIVGSILGSPIYGNIDNGIQGLALLRSQFGGWAYDIINTRALSLEIIRIWAAKSKHMICLGLFGALGAGEIWLGYRPFPTHAKAHEH